MRTSCTLLVMLGIAGALLLGACGGGGSEPGPQPGTAPGTAPTEIAGSRFSDIVASKLATALGLDDPAQATPPIIWETEDTSDWQDAELFADRILGEMEVPTLTEMQISVLTDKTAGSERTVVVRVQVADVTADYRVSMGELNGQWRVSAYEVEEIVEANGH
jgi:hypothetical protein